MSGFYCYKFESEAQFMSLAESEGLVTNEGSLITGGHGWALDTIGPIVQGGEWDADGNVIVEPTVIDGHHVNVQGIAPEAWDPHLVVVNSATRIFLGGPSQAPSDDVLEEMAV